MGKTRRSLRHRCLSAAALGLCAIILLAGCAATAGGDVTPAHAEWLENARLDAHESPEELYQKALEEGGALTVYSSTTRAMDTKNSFERQYPGLVVEIRDIRTGYLVDALLEEHEQGRMQCDVVVSSDNGTEFSFELLPMGVITKYVPADMADKLLYTDEPGHLPFMREIQIFCYNGAVWDQPPFSNIWELCEERFYGRVYVPNPLFSASSYALLQTIVQQDQLMREAYLRLYGEALETADGEAAGEVFIRRLVSNGLMVTNSSDEVTEAVGAPGQTEPNVGMLISSKLRMETLGYTLRPQYNLYPFAGVASSNSVMLVTGTPRVNTAKLFIRWLLGEANGAGEGYKPYIQTGTWPARSDQTGGDDIPFESINQLAPDKARLNVDRPAFEALWLDALAQARAPE